MVVRPQALPKMPVDFTGYWKMLANENFEEYLRALGKEPCGRGAPSPEPPKPGPVASAGTSCRPGTRAAESAAATAAARVASWLRVD